MGVPNTTTFSMQDVADFIDPPTSTPSLSQLITDANSENPSLWDPTYSGSKNSLLNFRNYGAGPTSFTGSSGQNDFAFLCSQTTATSYWHNGAGAYPTTGDIVYINSTGELIPFTSYTYMLTSGSYGLWLEFGQSGSSGEVTNDGMCSPP
jgi:hypothetical protein